MQTYNSTSVALFLTPLYDSSNSRIRQLADCQLADWSIRGLADAAGSSTSCFNCTIRLCGHIIQLIKFLA